MRLRERKAEIERERGKVGRQEAEIEKCEAEMIQGVGDFNASREESGNLNLN